MKSFIMAERERVRQTYITAPQRVISDYNNELEKINDYQGRQLLEMLQNADDESESAQEKVACIHLLDNKLVISNNGSAFSRAGITSLMYSYLSPKFKKQNKIGHKGTGFRSILNWARSIYIKSYNLSVRFAREYAIDFLEELMEDVPQIQEMVQLKSDEPYPIATLLAPMWMEPIEQAFENYDTSIVIELKDGVFEDIQQQIHHLNPEVLMFLNHLEEIRIKSPERNETLKRVSCQTDAVELQVLDHDKNLVKRTDWKVRSRTGQYGGQNYELKIAYTESFEVDKQVLYCYFPTDIQFPFPALVHGTFELSGNRNQLSRSKTNEFLLTELTQLMVDTAVDMTKRSELVTWDAMKLLTFDDDFDRVLVDLGFKEKLIEKIKENKLYPTISGNYISYAERPIFYTNPYADLLPAHVFPKLTVSTTDSKIIELLGKMNGCYVYKPEWFFRKLTELSETFNFNTRARLLRYITKDYAKKMGEMNRDQFPALFIDEMGHQIPLTADIFLPSKSNLFSIPNFIQIKFVHQELAKELQKAFGVGGPKSLAPELHLFRIHEYSFRPVLERLTAQTLNLLEQETKAGNKVLYTKSLLNCLFTFYKEEGGKESVPSDLAIPLLNREKKVMMAHELYFGKEYGAEMNEALLNPLGQKLFVGSPRVLGLEQAEQQAREDFLTWLGVAPLPRISLIEFRANEDLMKYIYQNMKFPFKLEGEEYKTAEELKAQLNCYPEFKVETVELLDSILEHVNMEDIIIWLLKDSRLLAHLYNGVEQNQEAKMWLDLSRKKYLRSISYKRIPSYILWRLQKYKWLKNPEGESINIQNCCLSKTITCEFSPLVEIPRIDYQNAKYKEYGISREDIEHLLIKLGAAGDLGDFPAETIYHILLSLPEMDPDGKVARAMYKQIVENKIRVDKGNPVYEKFLQEGQVLTKEKNGKRYVPVTQAYYVDNRIFCQEIINQFSILDLEKRSGKLRVKNILGVKPLEDISFQLNQEPDLHPLNQKFQLDFEDFKPYIYAYRLDKDKKHEELGRIRGLRIHLCTAINASYIHQGEEKPFQLHPYEYIHVGAENQIYLKLPVNRHHSLEDLKDDFTFYDTLSEMITGVLKVEELRRAFRELYSKKNAQKDNILRSDLDDDSLLKLYTAREKLGIATDPQRDFWYTLLSAYTPSKIIPDYQNGEQLLELIGEILQVRWEQVEEIFVKFDYSDYSSFYNMELILPLLKEINLDIASFNVRHVHELNLRQYYQTKMNDLKLLLLPNFTECLYQWMKNQSVEEKKAFIFLRKQYLGHMEFEVENHIHFDYKAQFFRWVEQEFELGETDLSRQLEFDLTALYNQHEEKFLDLLQQEDKLSDRYKDEFFEFQENQSLLYFGELNHLLEVYKQKYQQKKDDSEKGLGTLELNGRDLNPSSHSDLFERVCQDVQSSGYSIIDLSSTTKPLEKLNVGKDTFKKGRGRLNRPKNTEEIGFIGESYVYQLLVRKYGHENVEWVSDYARKAKINENGNDLEGYDIRYKNSKEHFFYVEVKSSASSDLVFHISKEEVRYGENAKENYEIIFVSNVLSKDRTIYRLRKIFKYRRDESFHQNPRFLVENDKYKIRFTIQ